jgi:hypothetical protein
MAASQNRQHRPALICMLLGSRRSNGLTARGVQIGIRQYRAAIADVAKTAHVFGSLTLVSALLLSITAPTPAVWSFQVCQ